MSLQSFKTIFERKSLQFQNPYLNNIIHDFNLIVITEDCQEKLNVIQSKKAEGIIAIDKYNETLNDHKYGDFFIICADYHIILVQLSAISLLHQFFLHNEETTIYYISPDIKSIIKESFDEKTQKIHFNFSDENDYIFINKEIPSFLDKCTLKFVNGCHDIKRNIETFWKITSKCVSGYLIKLAYHNSRCNRVDNYKELFSNRDNTNNQIKVEENEYLKLQYIGIGCSSHLYLVFLLKERKICLLKIFIDKNDQEHKLFTRERDNYLNIHHPLFPRYFGETEYDSCKCLLIEYIEGKTLNEKMNNLSTKDKMKILLEIMISIEYLHYNDYIYRDLKPNNIMLDNDNRAFLIDFDRMIKNPESNSESQEKIFTLNFASEFHAPEISENKPISNKVDIYSLGLLISYMFSNENDSNEEQLRLSTLSKQCTVKTANERPNITEIIDIFYDDFYSEINKIKVKNEIAPNVNQHGEFFFTYWFLITECQNVNIQITLASLYQNGFYIWKDKKQNIQYTPKRSFKADETNCDFQFIPSDISKSIWYYTLAANQNNSKAQFQLGLIYYEDEQITRDIKKAIYYLSLASNKNVLDAQFLLGIIYSEGQYVTCDIQKGIYYFSLAADQNDSKAQFTLGTFYYEGQYVTRDVNKAIHYLSLASNQNLTEAQFYLGKTFYEGQYVARDINKAIHYFSLASNQNYLDAQFFLGLIYFEGKYISRDINMAIHYLSLASNQNNPNAQTILGIIYSEGRYIKRDINKAINYFTSASNQNKAEAQFQLGFIYYEGQYIARDIKKAIHYFSLAADKNFAEAQYFLGLINFKGQYITCDIYKAIHYFSLASKQNHIESNLYLGLIYYRGIYIARDINKAIHYLKLAADLNDRQAEFNLGVIYYEDKYIARDINKAIHYFSLASKQNHLRAHSYLSKIYYDGKYVDQNINKAIYYLSLSSNQNDPHAQFILGRIYYEGKYVARDISKAIHYLSLAAKQNLLHAQFNLGLIYFEGKYFRRDINKSIHFLSLASNQNYPQAQFILGKIYYVGQFITRDIYKAIHYFSLASKQNYPQAQSYLGFIYCEGKYVTRDVNKAIHYLTLAANQNDSEAQKNLGYIYFEGKYVRKDINKAIYYFSLAANQNNSKAQFHLGLIYYIRKYNMLDINKAIYYLTLASNQNNSEAQFLLGIIYYFGRNYQQDIKKGRYYIMLASKNGNRNANFAHGFLLHEGKNIEKNIEKAVHYYKEASSFNNEFAKNNLGIIYKHGEGDKIKKNVVNSIVYFEEAIHQKDDFLSRYNLAHIYMYNEAVKCDIDKSIDLLFESFMKFGYSTVLLGIALIKKFGFNYKEIKDEIAKRKNLDENASQSLLLLIDRIFSDGKTNFENLYESYRSIDFVYDIKCMPIQYSDFKYLNKVPIPPKNPNAKDITSEFYEGFGKDLI